MNRQLALRTNAGVAAAAVPMQGILQRKCACGTHTAGGGACPHCARSESLVRRSAVASGRGPLLQRQEAPPEKPPEEKPREVAGGPEPESPGKLGKELLDRLEKALLPDTGSKVAAAAMAAGAVGALAANHEKLPMPIPIPLDVITPGLSVKIGVNGPLDAPTGIMFNFNYKAPTFGRTGRPTASEAYRAETARMAAELDMLRSGPVGPAAPYQASGIDTSAIAKSLGSSAAAAPGGLQLTLPPWSFKRKRRGLLGDDLKLEVPGLPDGDNAPGVQRKLSIGASDDPLELEADRVAEQITTSLGSAQASFAPVSIQRLTARPAAGAEEAPASVGRVLGSTGQPLEAPVRQDMEARFGHDFSSVRIHQDSESAAAARSVSARAFTVGNHITFGAGQYAPGEMVGRRLLAHELTHVMQQSAAPSSAHLQRKVTIGPWIVNAKERAKFLNSRKWVNKARASAILDDMADAFDIFDFDNEAELAREIDKRTSTVTDLLRSQEKAGGGLSGFGYPFSNDALLYGPRVNWSAREYWVPQVIDNYAVRTDKVKNKQLKDLPRHERCRVYGDQCGLYSWRLSDKGKLDPYTAMDNLFTPQSAHKRSLLHCDYLISIVNFMSLARSIGKTEFNKRVAAFGPNKVILYWNGFADLDKTIWEREPSGNYPADSTRRKVAPGLGSMQVVRPGSAASLVIGDHVVFSNHAAYDLINIGVGNAWRLENAVLIRHGKGGDIFLGHGSGEKSSAQMNAKLAEEYNDVADEAINLTVRADSKPEVVRKPALAKLASRFPNIWKIGTQWRVRGVDFCRRAINLPLQRLTARDVPGLQDPCDMARLGMVRRPIESAPKASTP